MLTITLALEGAAREKFLSLHNVGELELLSSKIRQAYIGWGREEPKHFGLLRQVERSVSGWLKVKRENIPAPVVVSLPPIVAKPSNGWNPPSRRLKVTA